LKDEGEISFLSVADARTSEIFVTGLTEEPLPVSKLLMKGMSDVFVSRFSEYFERKHLCSFTLKGCISELEFEKFIGIMTESPYAKEKEGDVVKPWTLKEQYPVCFYSIQCRSSERASLTGGRDVPFPEEGPRDTALQGYSKDK
jgi:hypothetical protein